MLTGIPKMTLKFFGPVVAAAFVGGALAQPNVPRWSDFRLLSGQGHALAMHDPDGAGPAPAALYIGGQMKWSDDYDHGFAVGRWDGKTIFPSAPANSLSRALVEHDPDGPGPEPAHLYAAIADAHGVWQDPDFWKPTGGTFIGDILDLATWDPDGPGPKAPLLIAGGKFTTVEGKQAPNIAAWNGAQWLPLGDGLNSQVNTLLVFDDDGDSAPSLFAGGRFTGSGGSPLGPIARWDGASWVPVSGLFESKTFRFVQALEVFDEDGPGPMPPRLCAAGDFATIDGITVNHIARFDGQSWLPLGAGLGKPGAQVLRSIDLDGDGPEPELLYVGGSFGSAGGLDTGIIAAWDGQQWSKPAFAPPNPSKGDYGYWMVRDLLLADPDGDGPEPAQIAIVGDLPDHAAGIRPFLSWDGRDLRIVGDALGYSSGYILYSGAFAMAAWDRDGDGPNPAELALGGGFGGFLALRGAGRTSLLPANLCCSFQDINFLWAPTFYAFTSWDDDGPGPNPPSLFASFDTMEGFEGQHLLRLDADGWHTLGPVPVNAAPGAFAAFDDDGPGPRTEALYCGGSFATIAGIAANSIARWDGQEWSPVGGGVLDAKGAAGSVGALIVFDQDGEGPLLPALFAGGRFVQAGESAAASIARWDGNEWTEVGGGITGPDPEVGAFAAFDEDGDGPLPLVLIAAGEFATAGGSPASSLARWDGASWSEVGGGLQSNDTAVRHLAVVDDDGPGPRRRALFVWGRFTGAGNGPAKYLARWDGLEWEAIPNAPYPRIAGDLRAFDDDGPGPLPEALYIGGIFDYQQAGSDFGFARWGCDAPPLCPGDCNADGSLDLFDFLCFVNQYNTHDPAADCTADGDFDFFDFVCFINLFNAGC
jgi:hypothetical protein